jgi:prepilin-type N-terminal cleavage/methylation domain-containing protein
MKRPLLGFTLVELLVVIAIISILAAIVVPKVQGHILRSRMVTAQAEINTINIALTKILTDSGKSRLRDLFQDQTLFETPPTYADLWSQIQAQTDLFYRVMRQGRNANVAFAEGVKEKLGTSYQPDLNLDPWDKKYMIYAGPWEPYRDPNDPTQPAPDPTQLDVTDIPFRSWRLAIANDAYGTPHGPTDDVSSVQYMPYIYDMTAYNQAEAKIPGNPDPDGAPGFPAPADMPAYIFSTGVNMTPDQNFVLDTATGLRTPLNRYRGGGDDINNWDKEGGWEGFYAG